MHETLPGREEGPGWCSHVDRRSTRSLSRRASTSLQERVVTLPSLTWLVHRSCPRWTSAFPGHVAWLPWRPTGFPHSSSSASRRGMTRVMLSTARFVSRSPTDHPGEPVAHGALKRSVTQQWRHSRARYRVGQMETINPQGYPRYFSNIPSQPWVLHRLCTALPTGLGRFVGPADGGVRGEC